MITKTTGDSASQRKVPGQCAEAPGFEPPMGANPNRISNPGPRGHGSVPRRGTPYVRQTEADVKRQFDVEYNWWLHEWRAWQARRIAIISALLEISVDQVEPLASGSPRPVRRARRPKTEPKLCHDRRFGPRKSWRGRFHGELAETTCCVIFTATRMATITAAIAASHPAFTNDR